MDIMSIGSKKLKQNSHFENAVAFDDSGFVGSSGFKHGADVLKRGVEFSINATQLTSFADLTSHVKAESCFRFDNFYNTGSCFS